MSSPPAVLDPPAAAAPPPPAPPVEAVAPPPVKEDVPPPAPAAEPAPEPVVAPPPPVVAEEEKPAVAAEPVKEEAPAAPAVDPPTDEALLVRLRALLNTVNLDETTEKQVRKQLEDAFGCSLKDRKGLISDEIAAFLNARAVPAPAPTTGDGAEDGEAAGAGEEGEDGDDEPAPPPTKKAKKGGKKKAPGGMEPLLSPELAAFVGQPRMHRFKIVKALWQYIKAHDLQDPNDKRNILPDAKLGTVLSAPVNMFSMNKQINRHIIPE